MSRSAGPVRQALINAIDAGWTGTYAALASVAGVPPERARAALWEIRRAGSAASCRAQGRGRSVPATYGRPREDQAMDALGFVRQVWR